MQPFQLNEDIKLFCVPAKSFPEGVEAAFKTLERMLPTTERRSFFGISHGSAEGNIIYKAAVKEDYDGEAEKYGCETYVVKKGTYLAETIMDWCNNKQKIGETFQAMIADSRLDPTGACVEWYKSDDELMCLVRINP